VTRTLMKASKVVVCVGAIITCVACVPALGQIDVEVGPPAEYIATATPVYFEGRPAYWYGNRWYYRDGPGWHAFREEPRYLGEYRMHHREPARVYYGRAHGGGFRRW